MSIYVDSIFPIVNAALKSGTWSSPFLPVANMSEFYSHCDRLIDFIDWMLVNDPVVFWNRIEFDIVGLDTPEF